MPHFLRIAAVLALVAAPIAHAADKLPGREISPGVREVQLPDGHTYRGGLKDGALDGHGEVTGPDYRYEGGYREGLKEGRGIYDWKNGDRYEGPFADDRPEGRGEFRFGNGDTYVGEVRAG